MPSLRQAAPLSFAVVAEAVDETRTAASPSPITTHLVGAMGSLDTARTAV
jgi:hypothetical protein